MDLCEEALRVLKSYLPLDIKSLPKLDGLGYHNPSLYLNLSRKEEFITHEAVHFLTTLILKKSFLC